MAEAGDPFVENLWAFLRGDRDVDGFEAWLYAAPDDAERRLGTKLFLSIISADLRDWDDNRRIKDELRVFALHAGSSSDCRCIQLRDLAVIDMGHDDGPVFRSLEQLAARGPPTWWLFAYRCRVCEQSWLVGSEERINDIYCFRRLTPDQATDITTRGVWPDEFDAYETLLKIGYETGRFVTFMDSVNAKALNYTVEDLARARPGISVSDLARLLHLSVEETQELARRAVSAHGVRIAFN